MAEDSQTAIRTGWLATTPETPSVLPTGQLRRYTLVLLRWWGIVGQTLTILIVSQILEFHFPILACAFVIGASILLNLILSLFFPLDRRVSNREAFFQLGFDTLQLSALLWLTGGITNPFAILFLAPVVTCATTLSKRSLFSLAVFGMIVSLLLVFYHLPLPWNPAGSLTLPLEFRLGVWVAIIVGSIFTSLYAWRATNESRKMAAALAAANTMLGHEKKLSALDGMAAAAAHELGTPLATIQVVAKEMSRELEKDSPLNDDVALLLSQAKRCRNILEQLSVRGDEEDAIHNRLSLEDLFEEAAEPYVAIEPDISIETSGKGVEPQIKRQAELVYALKNFIENAVDFADYQVRLSGHWTDDTITLFIDDDGPGFDPTIMSRLGQPYVTMRSKQKAKPNTAGGLGLGVFIATTLVERTGGEVTFTRSPIKGARIALSWPKSLLLSEARV